MFFHIFGFFIHKFALFLPVYFILILLLFLYFSTEYFSLYLLTPLLCPFFIYFLALCIRKTYTLYTFFLSQEFNSSQYDIKLGLFQLSLTWPLSSTSWLSNSRKLIWTVCWNFTILILTARISTFFQQQFSYIYCLQLILNQYEWKLSVSDSNSLRKLLHYMVLLCFLSSRIVGLLLLLLTLLSLLLLLLLLLLLQTFIFMVYIEMNKIYENLSNFTVPPCNLFHWILYTTFYVQ